MNVTSVQLYLYIDDWPYYKDTLEERRNDCRLDFEPALFNIISMLQRRGMYADVPKTVLSDDTEIGDSATSYSFTSA